jgi:hypothetical protein
VAGVYGGFRVTETEKLFQLKLQQVSQALDDFSDPILASVKQSFDPVFQRFEVSFDSSRNDAEKANNISLLLCAIGSIKDNLKWWCNDNGNKFEGETVLKNCKDCAIIHDLWNIDKHGRLDRKARSGYAELKFDKPSMALNVSAGPDANSGVLITHDLRSGKMDVLTEGSGRADLNLSANVFNGKVLLGELSNIARRALEKWKEELLRSGAITSTQVKPHSP